MRDEDIAQTESLKMNHLSVEEVQTRRAELAKMRDLMFRAEAKAKRIAKIKSKTYRRIKKKQKEKLAATLAELEGSDEEDEEMYLDPAPGPSSLRRPARDTDALRPRKRRRGGGGGDGNDFDLSDSDDGGEARRRMKRRQFLAERLLVGKHETDRKMYFLRMTRSLDGKGWKWRTGTTASRGNILRIIADRRAEREQAVEGVKARLREDREKNATHAA